MSDDGEGIKNNFVLVPLLSPEIEFLTLDHIFRNAESATRIQMLIYSSYFFQFPVH